MKFSELKLQEKKCVECGGPTQWLRRTQFAGDHPFCDAHARREKDFGRNDDNTDWVEVK